MSSCAGHMTTETVYGQTLVLQLGNGDEHHPLESDTTGQFVKGNLYLKGTRYQGGLGLWAPVVRGNKGTSAEVQALF